MAENQSQKISIHFNAFCGVLYLICGVFEVIVETPL
jgi:hypothetical protein